MKLSPKLVRRTVIIVDTLYIVVFVVIIPEYSRDRHDVSSK